MKRILCAALAALGLLLGTQQQASAWSKFNFGVGLNLGWEGAGNSVLWGVYKGGPAPGQMMDGGYQGGGHDMASMPMDPMAGMIAPSSYASNYSPYGRAMPMPASPMPGPMPAVQGMPQMPRADAQPVGYFTYPNYNYPAYPQYYYNPYYYGGWYGY